MEERADVVALRKSLPKASGECYVERTYRFQTLRWQIFEADCPPFVLFVTDVTRKELRQLGVASRKMAVVDDGVAAPVAVGGERWVCLPAERSRLGHRQLFERLSQRCASVHWAQWVPGGAGLVWRRSRGAVGDLAQFAHSRRRLASLPAPTPHSELSILAASAGAERVVIVADEVGAGKSTLMDSVAAKMADESVLNRVFKLELKAFAGRGYRLGDIAFRSYRIGEALDVVAEMVRLEEKGGSARADFLECCERGSPAVVLIFDGFDEIDREGQEKVLKLLKVLKEGSKVLLWVTTRFGEQADLEINLDTLAVSLEPLSKDQKVSYLQRYWKMKLKDFLAACEEESLENLRSYLRAALREMELCLVTLPQKKRRSVQIIMLMNAFSQIVSTIIKLQSGTEAVENAVSDICDQINSLDFSGYAKVLLSVEKCLAAEDDSQYVSTPLNLFLLAEITFDAKFQLPFVANTNVIYEKFIETKYLNFYMKKNKCLNVNTMYSSPEYFAHKEIALELLLPEETSTIFLNYEKVERELLEEIGIVAQRECGYQFTHHTFTEYFFCDWVVSDLSNDEVQKVLVKRILFEPNCSTVRKFLNLQIESSQVSIPLSVKVLEETNIFGLHDATGTLLHLLTEECLGSIMKMFLDAFPEEASGMILKTNSNLQNILHVACDLGFNRIIDIVLDFVRNHLSKEKTERLILQKDIWDESPFGCLYGKGFLGLFIDIIHDSNGKIDDEVCSYLLEINLRDSETTILTKSLIMEYPDKFDKLLEVALNKLSPDLYLQLVVHQIDDHGNTCLHNLAFGGSVQNLTHFWECAGRVLDDESSRDHLMQRNACGNTVIHEATLGSNGPVFRQLLQKAKLLTEEAEIVNGFLSIVNAEGCTVLHEAVSKSKTEFLRHLFDVMDEEIDHEDLKSLLTQTNRSLDTVLHLAARRGDAVVVEQVCSYVKDVLTEEHLQQFLVAKNSKGYTALHAAVEKGSADSVRILWDCASVLSKESLKACLTETNKYGDSVFHSATAGAASYVLKLLLEFAAAALDTDDVPGLLARDNVEGNTVLHVASVSALPEMAAYWLDFAGLAIARDAEALRRVLLRLNGEGESVLQLAVKRGEADTLRLLCARARAALGPGGFWELAAATDRRENTLLHAGVSRAREEVLSLALEELRREQPNELAELTKRANADGDTVFHVAVAGGVPGSILETLFGHAAGILSDLDLKDVLTAFNAQGKAALQLAFDKGDLKVVQLLCRLSKAALSEESLLEVLMNVNGFGETVLHVAVHLEDQQSMAEWCAFVRAQLAPGNMELLAMVPNQSGDTVLHHVLRLRKSEAILRFWLELASAVLGADGANELLKKRNGAGDTVLHLASSVADPELARHLCQHVRAARSADALAWMLMQPNKQGESPLHLVARKGDPAALAFWLQLVRDELGVEFLAELLPEANANGETVLHIAVLRDDVDVVRQLCACAAEVLEREQLKDFLTARAKSGANVLHSIVTRGNILMLKEFWECCEAALSQEALRALLVQTNGAEDTLVHLATTRGKTSMLNQMFVHMKEHLSSREAVKDVMMKRNVEGSVCIHISVSKGRFDLLTRLLDWHDELLDEETADEFILSTTSSGCTVLHLATQRGEMIFLNQLCDLCAEKLSRESLRVLVLLPDKRGATCLHVAAADGETAVLNRVFEYARHALEPEQLRSFFKKTNEERDNALHVGVRRGKLSIAMYLCEYAKQILEPEAIRRLLMRPNRQGRSAMDEAVLGGRNYYVEALWEYASSGREAAAGAAAAKGGGVGEYRQRRAARTNECVSF